MTASEALVKTFKNLCEIASPSGQELELAKYLSDGFASLGVALVDDGTAATSGGQCGNLLGRIPGQDSSSWLMLCAHIDTVPQDGPIVVEEEGGVLSNRHKTILGADNKAAVAVLVELARHYSKTPPPVGIEFLFTVCEEVGLAGAKAFDVGQLKSNFGYVFDHATPIGELLTAAPSHQRLKAEFIGRAAHAGLRPEDGRNAIVAAAKAVEAMPNGRLDPETTANVGLIKGGTAVNIVPDSCKLMAEARSLDHEKSVKLIQEMVDACNWGAGSIGADLKVLVEEEFRAYRLDQSAASVSRAAAALKDVGVKPVFAASGGGSDANAFLANDFECLNVANGTVANHTAEESVTVEALQKMLDFSHSLLSRCAADA